MNKKHFSIHGIIGIIFILIFWILNWALPELRSHLLFFPLWLGYSLFVDALVFYRKGASLFTKNWEAYLVLFIVSAPVWWLFELLNSFTQNWIYLEEDLFTQLEYSFYETLSFTTVIPAVFGTAELAGTFKWIKNFKTGFRVRPSSSIALWFFIAGWAMLILLITFPEYFFVFLWMSVYFIIEPLNIWLKNKSLLDFAAKGDWRPVIALWTGCIICGFFWEMWNYYSYPKWIYQVPYVDFLHIFEMPLIGYLGYLPFSVELFVIYHFIRGLSGNNKHYFFDYDTLAIKK